MLQYYLTIQKDILAENRSLSDVQCLILDLWLKSLMAILGNCTGMCDLG